MPLQQAMEIESETSSLLARDEQFQSYQNATDAAQPVGKSDNKGHSVYCYVWLLGGLLLLGSVFIVGSMSKENVSSSSPSNGFRVSGIKHPMRPAGLWGAVARPYPTGAFWTNLVIENGDGAIETLPYEVKCTQRGVEVSYSAFRRQVSPLLISDMYMSDVIIASGTEIDSRQVSSYDNVSVTMDFYLQHGQKMWSPIVKGSPFITVVYDGAVPVVNFEVMRILTVSARNDTDAGSRLLRQAQTGRSYVVELGNYQRWLVYCSDSHVSLVQKDNALVGSSALRSGGFIRVAFLPSQNLENSARMLCQFADVYPTGASTTVKFSDDDEADVFFDFTVESANGADPKRLLMLSLEHQMPLLKSCDECDFSLDWAQHDDIAKKTSDHSLVALGPYWCPKGKLHVIVGTHWKLHYDLVKAPWVFGIPAQSLTTAESEALKSQVLQDMNGFFNAADDPYGFGKQIARLARLVLCAQELIDLAGAHHVDSQLQYSLDSTIIRMEKLMLPWLSEYDNDALVYDDTYGGIVTVHGINDSAADFGSGWYSDHHFHYGYFVFAAVVIAKYDKPFFENYRDHFDQIRRDICNDDDSDRMFPIARHKDWFDGHSWASGLFVQANAKGQESSSEAVNAYYACSLYADALDNQSLSRFSRLLLTMEISATKMYWHMPDTRVYDATFAAGRMAGNIGGSDAVASTWFGSAVEFVHGINIMPLTPITAALFDAQFASLEWPVLKQRIESVRATNKNITLSSYCADNQACFQLGLTSGTCCDPSEKLLDCCDAKQNGHYHEISNEWLGLMFSIGSIIEPSACQRELERLEDFGTGGTKANALLWVAACRARLAANHEVSQSTPPVLEIASSCSANSACDSMGMVGECCPAEHNVFLGCCPKH